MNRRLPLVVILGATGSGKTKLSLELAQRFKGEILSADSMQVYKGLDIITAKATKEEQAVAPHHLLDILEPRDMCTVVDYRNIAVKIIDRLFEKNKLPIVVGGTNYYIESILWKILMEHPEGVEKLPPKSDPFNLDSLSNEELHGQLYRLDPAMANRLHPNNKRKIIRSLEILHQNGITHSQLIEDQQKSSGGSEYGGGLRYPNALILKLHCEKAVLNQRLDTRVDQMIQQGLLEELTHFHEKYNENRLKNQEPDYTKGIFQSIGFKEFHSYLVLNEEEKRSEVGAKVLIECIDKLKLVTRRYARKQNKWTNNRFLTRSKREIPPMYQLDTTDVTKWHEHVTKPAVEIIDSYISNCQCQHQPMAMLQETNASPNAIAETHRCEICDRIFIGMHQWTQHLESSRHRKMTARSRKQTRDNEHCVRESQQTSVRQPPK